MRRLHLYLAVSGLAQLALRPGGAGVAACAGQSASGPAARQACRHRLGFARPGQSSRINRRRDQDQRNRGRTLERRLGAFVHRTSSGRRDRFAGAGGPARRGRGRDGARRYH